MTPLEIIERAERFHDREDGTGEEREDYFTESSPYGSEEFEEEE